MFSRDLEKNKVEKYLKLMKTITRKHYKNI